MVSDTLALLRILVIWGQQSQRYSKGKQGHDLKESLSNLIQNFRKYIHLGTRDRYDHQALRELYPPQFFYMLVSLGYLYWVSYNCLIFLDETNTDTKAVRGDVQTYGRMYIQRYVLWDIIPWSRLPKVKEEVRDMVRGRCERRQVGLEEVRRM